MHLHPRAPTATWTGSAGAHWEERAPIVIGERLGAYAVLGLLGEGGMARVYLAEHTVIERRVAIKRLLPSLARFLVVFAVAYSLNLALVLALRRAGVDQAIAHAAGMPVYTLVFFLLSRWFVFNRPPRPVTDLVDATPQ